MAIESDGGFSCDVVIFVDVWWEVCMMFQGCHIHTWNDHANSLEAQLITISIVTVSTIEYRKIATVISH